MPKSPRDTKPDEDEDDDVHYDAIFDLPPSPPPVETRKKVKESSSSKGKTSPTRNVRSPDHAVAAASSRGRQRKEARDLGSSPPKTGGGDCKAVFRRASDRKQVRDSQVCPLPIIRLLYKLCLVWRQIN